MAITAAELVARIKVEGFPEFLSQMNRAHQAFNNTGAAAGQFHDHLGRLHNANGQFASMADRTAGALNSLGMSFGSLGGSIISAQTIVNAIQGAFQLVEQAAMAAGGAVKSFVEDALKEAIKLERLETTFAALFHSPEKGKEEMAYFTDMAKHTLTGRDDLARAGLRASAAGLNAGRFVGMADYLGQLMTPGSPQGMLQVIDALGRIKSGSNMGRAVSVLSRVGIGYNALSAEGVDIDKSHHIKSDPAVVIGALERIVQKKYGDMRAYLETTMATAFSNLGDAWDKLMERFGKALFPLVRSLIEPLTSFLEFITKSGEVEKIATSFASLFSGLKDGGWIRILMFGVAILEDFPNVLRSVWNYIREPMIGFLKILLGGFDALIAALVEVKNIIKELGPTISDIGDLAISVGQMLGRGPGEKGLDGKTRAPGAAAAGVGAAGSPGQKGPGMFGWPSLDQIFPGRKTAYDKNFPWFAQPFAARHRNLGDVTGPSPASPSSAVHRGGRTSPYSSDSLGVEGGSGKLVRNFESLLAQIPSMGDYFKNTTSPRTDQLMKEWEKFKNTPQADMANPQGNAMFIGTGALDEEEKQTEKLGAIQNNTGRVAASMEHFKRYALGGGERGKMGITLAQQYGTGAGGSIRVNTRAGAGHIERGISEMVEGYHQSMRRASMGH